MSCAPNFTVQNSARSYPPPPPASAHARAGRATHFRHVTCDQKEPGPTESRSRVLLSSRCTRGGYCRVTHGTGLALNETQSPCRT